MKKHEMKECDICGVSVNDADSTTMPQNEFIKLVRNGFNPFSEDIRFSTGLHLSELGAAFGQSRQEQYESWKMQALKSETDWLLCNTCFDIIRQYPHPDLPDSLNKSDDDFYEETESPDVNQLKKRIGNILRREVLDVLGDLVESNGLLYFFLFWNGPIAFFILWQVLSVSWGISLTLAVLWHFASITIGAIVGFEIDNIKERKAVRNFVQYFPEESTERNLAYEVLFENIHEDHDRIRSKQLVRGLDNIGIAPKKLVEIERMR